MTVVGRSEKGAYFDSVTLMTVAKEAAILPGVIDVAVVMGTVENKAILDGSGLLTDDLESAGDTDLLISIRAEDDASAGEALRVVDRSLKEVRRKTYSEQLYRPMSIAGALEILPDANLALISVPGRYAAEEARKALEAGLHVLLFSDNVSIEHEIELKRLAVRNGLLLMGPDCGSAIINGVPLAFANVVRRGDIGIVAASGTGLQEVSVLISHEGAGISQAIGTGGRDVRREIGGLMFLEALKALGEDEATKVIVLVSKPPDAEVIGKIERVIRRSEKPIVSVFLGSEPRVPGAVPTLEEAALRAAALTLGAGPDVVTRLLDARGERIRTIAGREARKCRGGRRFLRGLMSGGTFCAEAQVLLTGMISEVFSNVPVRGVARLEDPLRSRGNSVIDLGDDAFTVGRPHPMIDDSLRKRRILEEARDPETAVILLDVVLGYGANPDPASGLAAVIGEACEEVAFVCSITGTNRDPQNRELVEKALSDAGAIVMPSNASASRLAGSIVRLGGSD